MENHICKKMYFHKQKPSQMNHRPNYAGANIINLPEEHSVVLGKVSLDVTSEACSIKEKPDKLECIEMNNFCFLNTTIKS